MTAYVPSGTKLRMAARSGKPSSAASRATACWPAARNSASTATTREFSSWTLQPGASTRRCAPDQIIEIDNKSLTHRPDLWGHHGMAREVAAILRKPLRDPVDLSAAAERRAGDRGQHRRLRSVPAVQRSGGRERHGPAFAFVAAVPARSDRPESDQQHRRHHELDHGRDRSADARVRCRQAVRVRIRVRSALPGETMAALNGETYELNPSNLVIADDSGADCPGWCDRRS